MPNSKRLSNCPFIKTTLMVDGSTGILYVSSFGKFKHLYVYPSVTEAISSFPGSFMS